MQNLTSNIWWTLAGINGAIAVAAGAYGSHGIQKRVSDQKRIDMFKTASHYQLLHSIVLLMVPFSNAPNQIGSLFTAGVSLFSFSIYFIVLGDLKKLSKLTPIGGLLMIAGWAYLGLSNLNTNLLKFN
ncbi:hypothetical protein CYY_000015 [Polysphondylium violaceum]|uniref:DUF423-domain-containing protein n=1 Tax=Polysphondylium violaceum TaxID=133409 RepID=A0A8J4VBX8_9MYCE|nr:hypothetical protein CYY_000015 [Polysphondylium violaceum]